MIRQLPNSVTLLAPYKLDDSANIGSMGRFANLIVEELRKQGNISVKTIAPPAVFGHLAPSGTATAKWLGYVDKFVINQIRLRLLPREELIHICDQAYAMYVPWIARFPHVVTCHDTIAIEAALGLTPGQEISSTGKLYQRLTLRGLQRARLVVCDSARTRTALVDIAGVSADRLRVVHVGLNYPYRRLALDEVAQRLKSSGIGAGGQIIFHLGNNSFYKNRIGVLHIFLRVKRCNPGRSVKLIMAGPGFSSEMRSFVRRHNLEGSVVEIVNPSTEMVEALYNRADVFLYPSLDEGFGWPVIEAQACGTPVVSSNNGSLVEVAADSTLNADAGNEELLATYVQHLLSNSNWRAAIVAKGHANTRRFSLENMMRGYRDAYADALVAQP